MSKGKAILFVISGPSGVGKGEVLKRVCKEIPDISVNVSVATRAPRAGEIDGVHYSFISKERFYELVNGNGLYEYTETAWSGYGSPKQPVDEKLARGEDVILEIETDGASKVRKSTPCVSIFIAPPSITELKHRLEKRNTEDEKTKQKRIEKCKQELPCMPSYDYVVINDDLEKCISEVEAIIEAERRKSFRNQGQIENLLKNINEL